MTLRGYSSLPHAEDMAAASFALPRVSPVRRRHAHNGIRILYIR